MKNRIITVVIVVMAAVALTVGLTVLTSSPASGNALVCQHYLAQRDWVKHLVHPTLANAEQFATDVAVDAAQSSGKLHADLTAMSNDMANLRPGYASSALVLQDCTD